MKVQKTRIFCTFIVQFNYDLVQKWYYYYAFLLYLLHKSTVYGQIV